MYKPYIKMKNSLEDIQSKRESLDDVKIIYPDDLEQPNQLKTNRSLLENELA
jgi:hypothetical protein